MEKCEVCFSYFESSCYCCELTNKIQSIFDELGIEEYWISDMKCSYEGDSYIIEDMNLEYMPFSKTLPV